MNKILPSHHKNVVLRENISLKPYNSFRLAAQTLYLAEVYDIDSLQYLIAQPLFKDHKRFILGGGSNIVFNGDFEGLVVRISIPGIELINEDENHIWIKAGAGMNWHEFVLYCINHNYAGLENLSLIPGSVGAAPIQNIGAYGVEQDQVFHQLEAIDLEHGVLRIFNREDCMFAYRDSVFKNELKDKYIITSVTYKLNKKPELHLSYGDIIKTLDDMGVDKPTIRDVSNAVCTIRRSKLPDPSELGNSGSFFKNPVLEPDAYAVLKNSFPDIPGYVLPDDKVKVPAGWLIEHCGWKGKTIGNVGTHHKQALVIVNHGNATGEEIVDFAMQVKQAVQKKFAVTLVPEVNIV